MVCSLEGFKAEFDKVEDECDINSLCIRWLRLVSHDNGKEGEHAEKLIEVVASLLSVHA